MNDYVILELQDTFVTQGLNILLNKEFLLKKKKYSIDKIKIILDYILKYLNESGNEIKDQETFGCGSWLIKFVFDKTYIQIHELKNVIDNENVYEFDITLTITFFSEQFALCEKYNLVPEIPLLAQKVAISKEIYNGSDVNGVRYEAPQHMTGWYLTSNNFNGDIKTLLTDHLYHLIIHRKDLIKFLALPVGYRFYIDEKRSDVWKDEDQW